MSFKINIDFPTNTSYTVISDYNKLLIEKKYLEQKVTRLEIQNKIYDALLDKHFLNVQKHTKTSVGGNYEEKKINNEFIKLNNKIKKLQKEFDKC